jgi:TonB-like protein
VKVALQMRVQPDWGSPEESPRPIVPGSPPRRVRVSEGVSQALLERKVQPTYPKEARGAGIQGSVVMLAHISTEGAIKNLFVISGPPQAHAGRSRCGLAMAIQALSPARQSSGSRDTNHGELCIAVARLASRGQIFDLLVSPLTRVMRRLPAHRDGNGRTPPPDPESPARSLIRRSPCAAPLLPPRRA